MSNTTFDVTDYLSADDMRRIAEEEFRTVCRVKAHADFERILSNASYALVQRVVDAHFDGNMVETVKRKAVEVIEQLSAFTVFRRPDAWERDPSIGWAQLQDAVKNAAPLIQKRVEEIIAGMSDDDLRQMIEERVTTAIFERLRGTRHEKETWRKA